MYIQLPSSTLGLCTHIGALLVINPLNGGYNAPIVVGFPWNGMDDNTRYSKMPKSVSRIVRWYLPHMSRNITRFPRHCGSLKKICWGCHKVPQILGAAAGVANPFEAFPLGCPGHIQPAGPAGSAGPAQVAGTSRLMTGKSQEFIFFRSPKWIDCCILISALYISISH